MDIGVVEAGAAGGSTLLITVLGWIWHDIVKNREGLKELERKVDERLDCITQKVQALINFQIMKAGTSGERLEAIAILKKAR